jgi:hypothetical protein
VIPTCAEAELALRRAAEIGLIKYTPGDKDFQIDYSYLSGKSNPAHAQQLASVKNVAIHLAFVYHFRELVRTKQGMNLIQHLDYLFKPRSVAVIGASNIPGKWGNILAMVYEAPYIAEEDRRTVKDKLKEIRGKQFTDEVMRTLAEERIVTRHRSNV